MLGAVLTLWRRRYLILVFVAAALGLGALLLAVVLPRKYTADTLLQVDVSRGDNSRPMAPNGTPDRGASIDGSAIIESEARVIRSRAIARRVAEKLQLHLQVPESAPFYQPIVDAARRALGRPEEPSPPDADSNAIRIELAALALMRNIAVANDSRSYLITVSYTSKDPNQSALLANAIADEYLQSRVEASASAAQKTSEWLAGQIADARRSLAKAEQAVDAFRRNTGYVEAEPDGAGLHQQLLRDLTTQRSTARMTRIAAEGRYNRAKAAYKAGEIPSAQDLNGAPVIQRLLEAQTNARKEVADLSIIGPKHPGLSRANAIMDQVQQQLREEVERAITNLEGEVRSAIADEQTLETRIQEISNDLIAARGRENQLKSLQAEVTTIRSRLKLLTDNYEQASSQSGLVTAPAQVIVRAQPIPLPSGPRVPVVLGLTLLGGLGLGVTTALLLEKRDTGFRSAKQFEAQTETRCVGMVPLWSRGQPDGERRIFTEAVRLIAASLDLHAFSAQARSLLITSSVPGEGKSLLALALARSALAAGQRVLIVDWLPADHEEPGGVSSATLDHALDDPDGMFFSEIAAQRLVILRPSGAISPADRYSATVFSDMMRRAREHYDLIIIEAPPVLLVVDFAQLARNADNVVHVVSWNSTPRHTVKQALGRLNDFSVKLHGAVLTNVDLATHQEFRIEDQCSNYRRYERFFGPKLDQAAA
ncbi:GumC family protein [Enterovirga sp. CN4-39]|uniref:GumC family protein n=1 Tax=Enterovirga sp. CN4-39 TaxID=3400910 RepID=UPI003C04F762